MLKYLRVIIYELTLLSILFRGIKFCYLKQITTSKKMKLKENAMQILQDCLHSNEMLAIYLLEFGTDMPSNITKKDLISIIFKISRRKDLISVIMFLCQKLGWIATKEDGVLTKETHESDEKMEENTSEDNGLCTSKITPDESFTSIKSGQCSSKILPKDHETQNYQQNLTTKKKKRQKVGETVWPSKVPGVRVPP